jgi:hypothetical protein
MELVRIQEPGRPPELLLKSGDFVRIGAGYNAALNFEGSNTVYPLQLGERNALGWKVNNAALLETVLLRNRGAAYVPAYVVVMSNHDSGQEFLFRSALQLPPDFFDSRLDPIAHFQKYPYPRQHRLAAFTTVYNEGVMLRVWIDFYSRYIPKQHLYVIDHGGDAEFVDPYRHEVNVISIPGGELDHHNIASYCGYFQRFLLSKYEWVMHAHADEMLYFDGGPAGFTDYLAGLPPRSILKPAHAYDLLHDFRVEPPIDLSRPYTLQRNCLLPAPMYHKPLVASAPITWTTGCHDCVEPSVLDPRLWLVHLRDVDLGHSVARETRWKALKQSVLDRGVFNASRHDESGMREEMLGRLEREPITPLPDWMKGTV